jgi:hypothetical protein
VAVVEVRRHVLGEALHPSLARLFWDGGRAALHEDVVEAAIDHLAQLIHDGLGRADELFDRVNAVPCPLDEQNLLGFPTAGQASRCDLTG